MTDASSSAHDEMFAALCREVGFCLHPKGEKRVFEAEGVDFVSASGDLRRAVRDCLKANLPEV